MSIFSAKPRTAQQKAQRAQTRIFIRIACCAYLVYFVIIPLLRPAVEEDGMSPALRTGVAIAFIAATAFLLIITVRELVVNWKAGLYKAGAYEDDDGLIGRVDTGKISAESVDDEEAEDDEEDDDDDYEDDEVDDEEDDDDDYEDDEADDSVEADDSDDY